MNKLGIIMCISSIASGFCAESDSINDSSTYHNVSNNEFFLQTVQSDANSSDTTKTVSDSSKYEVSYKIRQLNLPYHDFKSKIINKSNINNPNKITSKYFEIHTSNIELKSSGIQSFTPLDLGLIFKIKKELKAKKVDLYSKINPTDFGNLKEKFVPFLNFMINLCTFSLKKYNSLNESSSILDLALKEKFVPFLNFMIDSCVLSLKRFKCLNENSSVLDLALIISPIELLYGSVKDSKDSFSDYFNNKFLKQNSKKS